MSAAKLIPDRAGTGVTGRRRPRRSASATTSPARRSRCADVRDGRGEDRGHHSARAVDHRAARVPDRTRPRSDGDRAPHRPAAVGVLGHDRRRSARGAPGSRRRGRSRGSPGSPPRCPRGRSRRARSGGAPASPGTRSSARSLRGSNQIGLGVEVGPCAARAARSCRPGPATTCAFVTTTPSPATQPLPCTPRPQAVPSTFTTLRAAARTCGVARDARRRAAATSACGPVDLRERVEAREAPAGRRPRAAAASLSSRRIAERWIGSRSSRAPGVWSATAPPIQTRPSPRHATSTAAAHAVEHAEPRRPGGGAAGSPAARARSQDRRRAAARRAARTAARRAIPSPR